MSDKYRMRLPRSAATRADVLALLAALMVWASALAHADEYRSLGVAHKLERTHSCPSTGKPWGHCPEYTIDH